MNKTTYNNYTTRFSKDCKAKFYKEAEVLECFRKKMHAHGIIFKGCLEVGGKFKRFYPDGSKRNKSGWYVLSKNNKGHYYGAFGVFGKVDKVKFRMGGSSYDRFN
jgi:hypothetical protein